MKKVLYIFAVLFYFMGILCVISNKYEHNSIILILMAIFILLIKINSDNEDKNKT